MATASRPDLGIGSARRNRLGSWLLAVVAASGCAGEEEKTAPSVSEPPTLEVVRPRPRVIRRTVGQPSFVESYERTSIYPKMTAFIEKWNVDIGDKVQKGQVLADLFVPELVEEFGTKKSTVQLDRDRVRFAEKQVEVAAAEVEAARARLEQARSILGQYEAEVQRWRVQVDRLDREVRRTVVDPQILLESENQWKSSVASRDAAKAAIVTAESVLLADEAKLAKAKVDVDVAKSALAVAESEEKRLEAWVGYLKLLAPFDGIIVARNANTWDFVLPSTGDPTALMRSPYLSPSGTASPVYVVDRTDIVRVFVDVPERDAIYIQVGSTAQVKVWAYRDAWLPATVTRISWALNHRSRTMRAEIDLPNPGSQILPGMYAYGQIDVERPGALALPRRALTYAGGKSFIWQYVDGKATRTEIQTGTADGQWVEVTNRNVKTEYSGVGERGGEQWVPIEPTLEVLMGSKLSILTEGARVRLAESSAPEEGGTEKTKSGATGAG